MGVTKSIASRARSKLLTRNSNISQLPSPWNRAMAGWSAGYRAALVRLQLTPGLISSLRGTAGSPPFISFSTSYREMDCIMRSCRANVSRERDSQVGANHVRQRIPGGKRANRRG